MTTGAINATKVLIQKNGSTIVGQGDFTATFNGELIDISNKSSGDWNENLDGELSGKQWVLAGSLTYNSDATFRDVRADALKGIQDDYTLTWTVSSGTAESITGKFTPHAMSDDLNRGTKVTTNITFTSSGEVTRTAAA